MIYLLTPMIALPYCTIAIVAAGYGGDMSGDIKVSLQEHG